MGVTCTVWISWRMGSVTVYVWCKQFAKFVPRLGHSCVGGINGYLGSCPLRARLGLYVHLVNVARSESKVTYDTRHTGLLQTACQICAQDNLLGREGPKRLVTMWTIPGLVPINPASLPVLHTPLQLLRPGAAQPRLCRLPTLSGAGTTECRLLCLPPHHQLQA